MRPKKLPLSASCCVWLVCTSVLGRGLKRYCNTLTVFEEHLQFWQVGMTWDASMIGCYSFSVDDASCSDCLSFFGQSWSSMTPLRSLSWRRVNRLSTHLKCLFFIWFYLEIVNMEIAPSSVGKEAPLLLKLLQEERSFDLGNCQGASEHVLVCLPILWLTSESSTILHGIQVAQLQEPPTSRHGCFRFGSSCWPFCNRHHCLEKWKLLQKWTGSLLRHRKTCWSDWYNIIYIYI